MQYPAGRSVSVEKVPITDTCLSSVWGPELIRVVLIAEKPATEDAWTYRISR